MFVIRIGIINLSSFKSLPTFYDLIKVSLSAVYSAAFITKFSCNKITFVLKHNRSLYSLIMTFSMTQTTKIEIEEVFTSTDNFKQFNILQ